MTGYVATRWYRAPEIMLNWMHYNQTGYCTLLYPRYGLISLYMYLHLPVCADVAKIIMYSKNYTTSE